MGDKTFNLTWNNHLSNLSGLFEGLYKSGSLTDTTLACQGGMLRAHRLVLAACSPYFERVFKEHYGEQPILILKGISVEEMECLLDFMYRGSIDVSEEHLPSLIKTATDLEIRGLSGEHRNDIANSYSRGRHCEIETRVSTTEFRKDPAAMFHSAQASLQTSGEPRIKIEDIEVEDDPMVIDGQDEPFDEATTSNDGHIRHIPPPMYKRETRFRGQKRVTVGRSPRCSELVDPSSKDVSAHGESYDESIMLQETMRPEINFTISGSDPTVPSIQMNDEEQEGDENAIIKAKLKSVELNKTIDTSLGDPGSSSRGSIQPKHEEAEVIGKIFADSRCEIMRNLRNTGIVRTYRYYALLTSESRIERRFDALEIFPSDSPRSYGECVKSPLDSRKKPETHGRPVSKNQYKPFSCDLCTLAFTRASHLARHRRVHTGERPFACNLCPRMFARQDKLKQHLDSHMQWPRRKANAAAKAHAAVAPPVKGKRGRPRKFPQVSVEQTAMDEILKFGEFSSLLNKSQQSNQRKDDIGHVVKKERLNESDEMDEAERMERHNEDYQIENGEDTV